MDATDKDAHAILEENGLSLKACFPAMKLDLASIEPLEYVQGLTITNITDLDAVLESWVEIVADSFELPSAELLKVMTLFKETSRTGGHNVVHCFLSKQTGRSRFGIDT